MKYTEKKHFLFAMVFLACCVNTFAADAGLGALKTVFGTIYWFFSSSYMLVICSAGLVWVAVKWITNRGEPTVVKDLAPKAGAMLIIGGASAICNLFFKPESAFEVKSLTDGSNIFNELK